MHDRYGLGALYLRNRNFRFRVCPWELRAFCIGSCADNAAKRVKGLIMLHSLPSVPEISWRHICIPYKTRILGQFALLFFLTCSLAHIGLAFISVLIPGDIRHHLPGLLCNAIPEASPQAEVKIKSTGQGWESDRSVTRRWQSHHQGYGDHFYISISSILCYFSVPHSQLATNSYQHSASCRLALSLVPKLDNMTRWFQNKAGEI